MTTNPTPDDWKALAAKEAFVTSASVMVHTAASSQAATVIHRGLLVRSRLLCQTPPPPPANFVPDPVQIQQGGDMATAKENYDFFAANNKGCNACHQNFHPLGLAFENYDDIKVGDRFASASRTLFDADIVGFAGISGDFNPLHVDDVFAAGTVHGRRIAHGMLVASVISGLRSRTSFIWLTTKR